MTDAGVGHQEKETTDYAQNDADLRIGRIGRGTGPDRLRTGRPGRDHHRGRPHAADHVDALRRQPGRARGLRTDHLRLQRLAGRVRGRQRVVPAGRLQRRDRRGGGIRRPAVPARPRRPDHAELGLGGLPPAARAADRAHRLAAADGGRRVGRPDLLGRILGCRAVDLRPRVGARGQRHPHSDDRRAVDEGRVRRRAGDAARPPATRRPSTSAPRTPASGGRTRTRRSCRASAAT